MVSLWRLVMSVYNIAGPLVILAYPLYASVLAIESRFKEEDTQWLTYWVLYSFLQLIEYAFDRVLVWFPFWYLIKLAVICWLVLPQFRGAEFVYNQYVSKFVVGPKAGKNQKLSPSQRQLLDKISPEGRASMSAFIQEYGSDAFDKVIDQATRMSKSAEGSS